MTTSADSSEQLVILVIQAADTFSSFLNHFPNDRYEVLYTTIPPEALVLCETRSPRLIVIPTDDVLVEALVELRDGGCHILGLAPTPEERRAKEHETRLYDRVVLIDEPKAALNAARELLSERREHPRVSLEFPVKLGSDSALVRQFSSTSLQVETDVELRAGKALIVEIGWGPKPRKFWAIVGKVQPTVFFGEFSVVLYVHPQETEAKAYLSDLAQRVIELRYLLAGENDGMPKGIDPWLRTRRAEILLRTGELMVDDSGDLAIDPAGGGRRDPTGTTELEERYQISRTIGVWGVGEVSRAHHRLLKRPVLLKTLEPELRDDRFARRRMEREAQLAASLPGRSIVDVIDFGDDGRGGLYYAMEELQGETLAEALSSSRGFNPLETAMLGVHLAEALAIIHLRGQGHFDLCPGNIFLHRPGATAIRPVLIGLAGREVWGPPMLTHAQGARYRPNTTSSATCEPDCDIYALARVMQEMLGVWAGQRPNDAPKRSPGELFLDEVIAREASPIRSKRFTDAEAFKEALENALDLLEEEVPPGQARLIEPLPDRNFLSNRPTPVKGADTQSTEPPPPAGPSPLPQTERPTPTTDLTGAELRSLSEVPDSESEPPPAPPTSVSEHPPAHPTSESEHPQAPPTSVGEPPPAPPTSVGEPPPAPPTSESEHPQAPPTSESEHPQAPIDAEADDDHIPDRLASPPTEPEMDPEVSGSFIDFEPATPSPAADLDRELTSDIRRRGRFIRIAAIAAAAVLLAGSIAVLVLSPWRTEALVLDGAPNEPEAPVAEVPTVDAADRGAVPVQAPEDDGPPPAKTSGAEPNEPPREPPSPEELIMRARHLIDEGSYEEAGGLLQEALGTRESAEARSLLSRSYEKRRSYRAALEQMMLAIRLAPANPNYHDQMGKLRIRLGHRQAACDSFRKALKSYPHHRAAQRHIKRYCRDTASDVRGFFE